MYKSTIDGSCWTISGKARENPAQKLPKKRFEKSQNRNPGA